MGKPNFLRNTLANAKYTPNDFSYTWLEICEKLYSRFEMNKGYPDDIIKGSILEDLEYAKAAVLQSMGVACDRCSGVGRKSYSSTATWRGGIGGASITEGICDKCWGSGRLDKPGVNLRSVESAIRQANKEASRKWLEQRLGVSLSQMKEHLPTIATKLKNARWGKDFWLNRCADSVAEVLLDLVKEKEKEETKD